MHIQRAMIGLLLCCLAGMAHAAAGDREANGQAIDAASAANHNDTRSGENDQALPQAPGAISPSGDPATYTPKTQFDNTPWRFDMSQNGKRMTADEFSAWMQARGVRVAKGAPGSTRPATAPAVQDAKDK